MLRRQHKVDDQHHDMPLIYYMEAHKLHFGRREFSLITGFRFGIVSFDLHSSGELKFWNRVFPNKIGFSITNLDIIGVIEDEEIFSKDTSLPFVSSRDYPFLFAKESRSTSDLRPTIAKYQSSWWIDNNLYFQEFVPRAPPIKEHHGIFETYLSKVEKARKRRKTGFMVSSIGGTTDNSFRKNWLNDLVIMELNFCLFKLETIIQFLSHERSNKHAKLKFTDEFSSMTSDLCDSLNSMFADLIEPADPDEDIGLSSRRGIEIVFGRILREYYSLWTQFDRNFWLKLVCLDPASHLFVSLNEQHIDLWVDYMWYVKPENSNWAMVSCYFVQLLLQNGMPLFYANGERYTTTWSEVDQVFFLINETGEHWCLAQIHIMSGEVTFYDTGHTYDYDYRDDFQLVRDTYVSFQYLMVRYEERHEQILELQNLVGSTVVAECARLLQKFQQDNLESSSGMMRLICQTQLKVLKKPSFIALLRKQ
ncbi:phospholipase-like protein [Tanacetum coccineum]